MQLRTNVRRPGRYREEDVDELPPNPRFVVPTIPFNPNLRPAVFPTLQWDELDPDHPPYVPKESVEEVEDQESENKSQQQEGQQEEPIRNAFVFRDNRTVPIMETEEGLVQLKDGSWLAIDEPGEFDEFAGMWDEDDVGGEAQERCVPTVGPCYFLMPLPSLLMIASSSENKNTGRTSLMAYVWS